MLKLLKYVLYDIMRTRFTVLYTVFLAICTIAMFQLDNDVNKVTLSLLNIVLMIVPLVSVVFATVHFYNSYEFIELMLAQPVNRKSVFFAETLAVGISLSSAFAVGVGLPLLAYGITPTSLMLLFSGILLTLVFTSLAFLASVLTRDKAKAIGIALIFWLFFSLLYDGLILWIIYYFSDYPIDKLTLTLISFNPVDLARILMIMQLDISALMGYTGAFFRDFFTDYLGMFYAMSILALWYFVPLLLALRIFKKKDL